MPGRDWLCQECGYKNFARNSECAQCGTEPELGRHLLGRMSQKGKESHWWCHDCGGRHAWDVYLKCPNPVRGGNGGGWNGNNSGWGPSGNQSGSQQQGSWGRGQQSGSKGREHDSWSHQQGKGPEGWGGSGKGKNDPWATYLEKQHHGGSEPPRKGWSGPAPGNDSSWWDSQRQGKPQGGGAESHQKGWPESAPDNNSGWWNSQGKGQPTAQGGGDQWKDSGGGKWHGSRSDQGWKQRGGSGNSKKNSGQQQDSWSKDHWDRGSGNWDSQKQQSKADSPPGKEPFTKNETEDDHFFLQARSWTQKCEGCEQTVPTASMKKTYQLSGNVRKDVRCPKCFTDYQRGVYQLQMMENMTCGLSSVDRFDNWATDSEVRQLLCTMVEKCTKQLGYQLRAASEPTEGAGSSVAGGPSEAGGGSDAQGVGDGAGSVSGHSCGAVAMSMWEFVESGQTPVFESSGPNKNRTAEAAGLSPESNVLPPPPKPEEPQPKQQPPPPQSSSGSSSSSSSSFP